MSRTFSVGPEGNLCLDILWWNDGDVGRFQLLNSSGEVDKGRLVTEYGKATRLNFTLGRGGDFKLRLLDVKREIIDIGACAAEMKIWSPSNGCYVYKGANAYDDPTAATIYSAQLNESLRVDLTHEQMLKVCAALEVQPGDPPLKFSSWHGAAFAECPSP